MTMLYKIHHKALKYTSDKEKNFSNVDIMSTSYLIFALKPGFFSTLAPITV